MNKSYTHLSILLRWAQGTAQHISRSSPSNKEPKQQAPQCKETKALKKFISTWTHINTKEDFIPPKKSDTVERLARKAHLHRLMPKRVGKCFKSAELRHWAEKDPGAILQARIRLATKGWLEQDDEWQNSGQDTETSMLTIKQQLKLLKNGGSQAGILDGLLSGSGLEFSWKVTQQEVQAQMRHLVQDCSLDRSQGPGASSFTRAVAQAVLKTEPVAGEAPCSTPEKDQSKVDSSIQQSLSNWDKLRENSSLLMTYLQEGFNQPEDPTSLLEREVIKEFDTELHSGTIKEQYIIESQQYWKVVFKDGDIHDMDWPELVFCLREKPTQKDPSEQSKTIEVQELLKKTAKHSAALSTPFPQKQHECRPKSQQQSTQPLWSGGKWEWNFTDGTLKDTKKANWQVGIYYQQPAK